MQNQLEMLRIFKVVAESLNFKEAAVRLGISPQSVTRAIKELEDQLGEPLSPNLVNRWRLKAKV
jgi:DNA-binding transcriptional LysR family regulator